MTSDRLIATLAKTGIATFLLISAFAIHRARREPWQLLETRSAQIAAEIFGQPVQPLWLYAVAFPFVAVNFGCMIAMIYKKAWVKLPFAVSTVAIAVMDLVGWQTAVTRDLWSDILTKFGFAIGGALLLLHYLPYSTNRGTVSLRSGRD